MAHFHHTEAETRTTLTPKEWLTIGADIGTLVNLWSLRSDLVTYVGPGAGGSAPACYNPAIAEVEVNVEAAFGKTTTPADIGDITDRKVQYEFPRAIGAMMHEAFHARFSQWSMPKAYAALADDEYKALVLLEESRIEAFGSRVMSKATPFLRSSAMDLVIEDAAETFGGQSDTASAGQLVALVYGRVDAGILDLEDVLDVTDLVDDYLGESVIVDLRAILQKAQEHDDHANAEPLYDLAREWARILREVAEEKGESPESGSGESGDGESGMSSFGDKLMEALSESADSVAISNSDALDDQEQSEDWQEQVKSASDKAKEKQENKDEANKVFAKATGPGSGGTSSRLLEERQPKQEERIAAVKVARMLEKAKYRERDEVEIASVVPPGRLRTRALVQGAALRERGVLQQPEAWKRKVRKHTDEPTLNVGVLVDISGSMGAAMEPMGVTAWIMSEAVKRVQGKAAMVYYGNSVFPTLRRGEHQSQVRIWSAPDGTEKFDQAFRALDGEMNLLHGSGARLLVVVSDGAYTPDEQRKAVKWVRRCTEEGVAILWLPFDGGHYARDYGKAGDIEFVLGNLDPAKAAQEIGNAAAKALTRVGQRAAAA